MKSKTNKRKAHISAYDCRIGHKKDLDLQKQMKDYKKKLLSFLLFYCKANPKFYNESVLTLFDDGKEQELGTLLRDTWVKNNITIRADRTKFINNSLYLDALVNNLLDEIPRVYKDEQQYYDDVSDIEEEEEESEENKQEDVDVVDTVVETSKASEVEVEESVERPQKKRKTK